MKSLQDLLERFKAAPKNLTGIDVGSSGIKTVRMRKSDTEISVLHADILPPVEVPEEPSEDDSEPIPPLALPAKLRARYACLAVSGEKAIIKLLGFPGHFGEQAEAAIVQNMGMENPDEYRIGYKLTTEGHGKLESKVLAVALSEYVAGAAVMLLPTGLPAPFSLEVSGLAAMTAFLHTFGEDYRQSAVGVIDFGTESSSFALFNKGNLALFRRFDFGVNALMAKVQETLGVNEETAQGIVSDGSFDISQSVSEVMEPFVKQLIVSRDFIERRENCHIAKLYVSGGLVVSRDALDEMRSSIGLEVDSWNPFEKVTVLPGALPEDYSGREWQFAAAVGACLATFEET